MTVCFQQETDTLSATDQWVETGKAPDRITASNGPN
jgi:hypothetical protein